MKWYLIDCNHMGLAVRKISPIRDRIQSQSRKGDRFVTCHSVLCELEAGLQQTGTLKANHRRLDLLLDNVSVWPLTL